MEALAPTETVSRIKQRQTHNVLLRRLALRSGISVDYFAAAALVADFTIACNSPLS